MKTFRIIISATIAMLSSAAFGQSDVSTTVKSEENPRMKLYSAEIRPVETLASAIPGVATAGLSFEASLGHNLAVDVGGSYADVSNLPNKFVSTTNNRVDQPLVNAGYGYTAAAGIRYYAAPIGDSFYGAGAIDYSEAHFGWGYKGEDYSSRQIAVTPSLMAGYRWVWQNGVLARLGAGAGLPSTASEQVKTDTAGPNATTGESKVKSLLDQKVMAKLDLGVGMMF